MPFKNHNTIQHAQLIFASDRPGESSAVLDIATEHGRATTFLDLRLARLLVVMQDAFAHDGDRPNVFRGLRGPERLAERVDPSPTGYQPSIGTIRAYFSIINRRLRETWAELGLQPPKLFTSLRGAGFRLLHPLDIQYLERSEES
jgi:hypothetical protein